MAHLHFTRTVYKSGGGKATARIAYITRQPEREVVYPNSAENSIGLNPW
jgi:hypothetical protein